MVVTFCGHNEISDVENIKPHLYTEIEKLIEDGADKFYLGGYGKFDLLAAQAVCSLKKEQFPHIRSILVLPYLNREYDKALYDETVYPPLEKVPLKFAISKRNEWMIDNSDAVVCYVVHSWGGAAASLNYALRKKKRVIRIAGFSENDTDFMLDL
ncbi:MAG: DUF1273 family protein [Clostridia bacterium]|nr:DUF1273 family protein [Clostridia bacterium]